MLGKVWSANSFGKFIQLDAHHNIAAYRLIRNVFFYSYKAPFIIQWLPRKKKNPLTEKINNYNQRITKLRQQVASNKHKCLLHVNIKAGILQSVSLRGYGLSARGTVVRLPAGAKDQSLLRSVQTGSGVHPATERMHIGLLFARR